MAQHALKMVERRQGERTPIRFVAHVAEASGRARPVQVLNISREGFMARCDLPLKRGATIGFTAPNGETFSATIRWAQDGRIGCRFATPLEWEDVLGLGLDELDPDALPAAPRKPKR